MPAVARFTSYPRKATDAQSQSVFITKDWSLLGPYPLQIFKSHGGVRLAQVYDISTWT